MTTAIHASVLVLASLLCLGCGVTTVRPFVGGLDGGSGGTAGTSTDAAVGDCESDLDCPMGEECEIEDGSSFCKPHGGGGGSGGSNSGPG